MVDDSKVPLVSIVSVNYNGKKFLPVLLNSLRETTYPEKEILLIDNASQDGSVQFVQANFPEVTVRVNRENLYFAGGNNVGIRMARGKYICLVNNDVRVHPGFLEPIVEFMEASPQVAICQPKILSMDNPEYFEYAGAAGGYLDILGYPFLRGRIFHTVEKDEGQYDSPAELFWASGACMVVRKSALEQVGEFDQAFQMHMEEIDLAWRMKRAGWYIRFLPQSKVWHKGGGTLPQENPRKIYLNFRNNLFLLTKHLSFSELAARLPLRMLLDGVAFCSELMKLKWANAAAVIQAYFWILTHVFLLWRRRSEVQRQAQKSSRLIRNTTYPGSIVLEYFLLGRKKFSDLLFHNRFQKKIVIPRIDYVLNAQTGMEKIYE